jgi:hypothetical protein
VCNFVHPLLITVTLIQVSSAGLRSAAPLIKWRHSLSYIHNHSDYSTANSSRSILLYSPAICSQHWNESGVLFLGSKHTRSFNSPPTLFQHTISFLCMNKWYKCTSPAPNFPLHSIQTCVPQIVLLHDCTQQTVHSQRAQCNINYFDLFTVSFHTFVTRISSNPCLVKTVNWNVTRRNIKPVSLLCLIHRLHFFRSLLIFQPFKYEVAYRLLNFLRKEDLTKSNK